jgi:hypothetical protein
MSIVYGGDFFDMHDQLCGLRLEKELYRNFVLTLLFLFKVNSDFGLLKKIALKFIITTVQYSIAVHLYVD